MIVSMTKNGLDPRLYAYLQKRRQDKKISEDMISALTEIFANVVLPPGQLPPDREVVSVEWKEIERRTLDARNGLWKSLMRLDLYLHLYKKTDEEAAEMKKEAGLILSAYV